MLGFHVCHWAVGMTCKGWCPSLLPSPPKPSAALKSVGSYLLLGSVPSEAYELGPILPNSTKLEGFLHQKFLALAENWLNH